MPSTTDSSELDRIIPAEVKNDPFYHTILSMARTEDIRTVLEIGSSSGEGSTEAFVRGLRENPNRPLLFCMEVSKPRFEALRQRYATEGFVRPYHVSSVPVEKFPDENRLTAFYHAHLAARFSFPLQEFLRWRQVDIDYIRSSGVPANGIQRIKQENGIEFFDMVLIDGSEFTGQAELEEVYGARFILLDDSTVFKNRGNFERLMADPQYRLRESNERVRNGYAVFEKVARDSSAEGGTRVFSPLQPVQFMNAPSFLQ